MSDEKDKDPDAKAMELIRASGVLNPNVTMDKIMDVTQRLSELTAVGQHCDSFIHRHFVYKHCD
jgi:hypothetical protein